MGLSKFFWDVKMVINIFILCSWICIVWHVLKYVFCIKLKIWVINRTVKQISYDFLLFLMGLWSQTEL